MKVKINLSEIIELVDGAKIAEQKEPRVPAQLQEAVDAEIKSLLETGHTERIDKLTDETYSCEQRPKR